MPPLQEYLCSSAAEKCKCQRLLYKEFTVYDWSRVLACLNVDPGCAEDRMQLLAAGRLAVNAGEQIPRGISPEPLEVNAGQQRAEKLLERPLETACRPLLVRQLNQLGVGPVVRAQIVGEAERFVQAVLLCSLLARWTDHQRAFHGRLALPSILAH